MRDHVVEIPTERNREDELFSIRVLEDRFFNVYTNYLGLVQKAGMSSMCLRVLTYDGLETIEGASVEITNDPDGVVSDGPYYIRGLTPVEPLTETTIDGRVCFQCSPGLVNLSFSVDDEVYTATVPLVPGAHRRRYQSW